MNNFPWWEKDGAEICNQLHTDKDYGLKPGDVRARQQAGMNELQVEKRVSPLLIFLNQFTDTMVLVLLAATVFSGIIGDMVDSITMLAIVVLNALLGFIQEYKAEKSLEEIKKLAAPYSTVIRGGVTVKIPSRELVVGDIVLLEAGDKVPADMRLIETSGLLMDEAPLTGESIAVEKNPQIIDKRDLSLAEQYNMAFMGTTVIKGRGKGIVVNIGMQTVMGEIADLMKKTEKGLTPLQLKLDQLGKILIVICILVCGVVAFLGVLRGEPLLTMLLAGISLAVAAIPEGLPAIVTVVLALGVQRMAQRNAIIRKLPAVETLGSTTVICSDKTGTITKNQMTVKKLAGFNHVYQIEGDGYEPRGSFYCNGKAADPLAQKEIAWLMEVGVQCNNSVLECQRGIYNIQGDPTEGALLVMARKAGYISPSSRLKEFPFDSERKRMSVIVKKGEGYFLLVKGALDVLLNYCSYYQDNHKIEKINAAVIGKFNQIQDQWAQEALRVLGFAYKPLPAQDFSSSTQEELEKDLILLGICGMIDPPRDESKQAVASCFDAGIIPIMITGDHPKTASAIARQVGINDNPEVITGIDIDKMKDSELYRKAIKNRVFARVSPQHKNRIVNVLKKKNQVVAMTGDGVNDAPAIKAADIGIAMGTTGTQVTKEASSMILTDDNFSTIVAAIYEGRAIYDNIRKFIRYLLGCNIGEVLLMFIASLIGMPLPMLPIQILWVNLITDGLPAMALGLEPPEPNIMKRRPRDKNEGVFARGLGWTVFSRGVYIASISVLVFFVGLVYSRYQGITELELARTMAFTTLVFAQLFYVFECRSENFSPFELGFFKNRLLLLAVSLSIIMHLTVIYNPGLQKIFQTAALDLWTWLIILLLAGGKFMWKLLVFTGRRLLVYSYNYAKIN